MILATMVKRNVHLKRLKIMGSSIKKDVSSLSLEVAPQIMSMPSMCDKRACETCKLSPPRKMDIIGTHFKFSSTIVC